MSTTIKFILTLLVNNDMTEIVSILDLIPIEVYVWAFVVCVLFGLVFGIAWIADKLGWTNHLNR